MKEKIEHTVKVDADAGCCSGGSWCKFFFQAKDKSTVSHPVSNLVTPVTIPLEVIKK